MRRGYVDTEFGQIHFREAGHGSPLLLLHKSASSSTMYSQCIPLLAEHYWTIAMDTPGFGMSDPLRERPGETLAPYRKATVEFMDGLGIERASLLGHSTGAGIAIEVAAIHPDRVDKLVCALLPANETEADREALIALIREHLSQTWLLEPVQLDAHGDFLEEYPLRMLRALITWDDPEHFLQELIAHLQALPNPEWAAEGVMAAPGVYAHFSKLQCPTLVLSPSDALNYASTKKAATRIKGGVYQEVPGAVEFHAEHPEIFAETVLAFLEGATVSGQ